MNSLLSGFLSGSKNFSEERFNKTLQVLAKGKSNQKISLEDSDNLTLYGRPEQIRETFRSMLGFRKRTNPVIAEFRLIDLLQRASDEKKIQTHQLKEIYSIAKKLGVVVGDKRSEAKHRELSGLIKEIMEQTVLSPQDSLPLKEDYRKRFFLHHKEELISLGKYNFFKRFSCFGCFSDAEDLPYPSLENRVTVLKPLPPSTPKESLTQAKEVPTKEDSIGPKEVPHEEIHISPTLQDRVTVINLSPSKFEEGPTQPIESPIQSKDIITQPKEVAPKEVQTPSKEIIAEEVITSNDPVLEEVGPGVLIQEQLQEALQESTGEVSLEITEAAIPQITSKEPTTGTPQGNPSIKELLKLLRDFPLKVDIRKKPLGEGFQSLMHYPYSLQKADGVDRWIYDVFLLAKCNPDDQKVLAKERLESIEKLGFANGFSLLGTLYRLTNQFKQLPGLNNAQYAGWKHANLLFGNQLKAFIEKHPKSYQKLNIDELFKKPFNKNEVDAIFVKYLNLQAEIEKLKKASTRPAPQQKSHSNKLLKAALVTVAVATVAFGIYSMLPAQNIITTPGGAQGTSSAIPGGSGFTQAIIQVASSKLPIAFISGISLLAGTVIGTVVGKSYGFAIKTDNNAYRLGTEQSENPTLKDGIEQKAATSAPPVENKEQPLSEEELAKWFSEKLQVLKALDEEKKMIQKLENQTNEDETNLRLIILQKEIARLKASQVDNEGEIGKLKEQLQRALEALKALREKETNSKPLNDKELTLLPKGLDNKDDVQKEGEDIPSVGDENLSLNGIDNNFNETSLLHEIQEIEKFIAFKDSTIKQLQNLLDDAQEKLREFNDLPMEATLDNVGDLKNQIQLCEERIKKLTTQIAELIQKNNTLEEELDELKKKKPTEVIKVQTIVDHTWEKFIDELLENFEIKKTENKKQDIVNFIKDLNISNKLLIENNNILTAEVNKLKKDLIDFNEKDTLLRKSIYDTKIQLLIVVNSITKMLNSEDSDNFDDEKKLKEAETSLFQTSISSEKYFESFQKTIESFINTIRAFVLTINKKSISGIADSDVSLKKPSDGPPPLPSCPPPTSLKKLTRPRPVKGKNNEDTVKELNAYIDYLNDYIENFMNTVLRFINVKHNGKEAENKKIVLQSVLDLKEQVTNLELKLKDATDLVDKTERKRKEIQAFEKVLSEHSLILDNARQGLDFYLEYTKNKEYKDIINLCIRNKITNTEFQKEFDELLIILSSKKISPLELKEFIPNFLELKELIPDFLQLKEFISSFLEFQKNRLEAQKKGSQMDSLI